MTLSETAQAHIDSFKRPDGVIDFYRVLEVEPSATADEIEAAFHLQSATYYGATRAGDEAGAVRYVLVQSAFRELGDPAKRKKYDALCRHTYDHARLLVAIDTERQRQAIAAMPGPTGRLLSRANTKAKRTALLALPFFAITATYRGLYDLDHYDELGLLFWLSATASVLCAALAFTRLSDWLNEAPRQ